MSEFSFPKKPKIKPFECGLCKKTFSRKDHLRNHQLTHADSRQFRCTIDNCQKTFRRKDRLSEHMINFHNLPKAIFCHICNITFTSKSQLSKHMNNQHYAYKCSVCKAGFEEYEEMVKHQRIYCKSEISVNQKTLDIVSERNKSNEECSGQSKLQAAQSNNVRMARVVDFVGGNSTPVLKTDSNADPETYNQSVPIWWQVVEIFVNSQIREKKDPTFSYDCYLDWCRNRNE
ncbi:zinc finger protein 182-like [Octopus sinensis]|uniref:Zinc finger protein 182-like n=1 Tax=Octopus sinensis TaxID=2607531 RepID=A0A6P7U2H4_9MOLL|nr:zinc finger protein 182-like [Octopus sinensis]